MFRKKKHDRIRKAVETLQEALQTSGSRKPVNAAKYEPVFLDIYDCIISIEPIPKEELYAAVGILYQCVGCPISSIQMQADQTLKKTFRMYLLRGQAQKIITLILNDLNMASLRTWKSVSVGLHMLAYYIQYTRASKSSSYVYYYLSTIAVVLKRPEEGIQAAVEKTFSIIMKYLGPYLTEQSRVKEEELFEYALKNIELAGSAGRAAAIVLAELAKYNIETLVRVIKLIQNILVEEENNLKRKTVNALITLKLLWPLLSETSNVFALQTIQLVLLLALKLLLSAANEITVASLELIELIFASPSDLLRFIPSEHSSLPTTAASTPIKRPNNSDTLDKMSQLDLIVNSPWGSVTDIYFDEPMYQASNHELASLDAMSSEIQSDFDNSSTLFVDPLVNTYPPTDAVSLYEATVEDVPNEIERVWNEGQFCPFPILAAAVIVRRFLIVLPNGTACDDNLRISHKVLAFKCLDAIFTSDKFMVSEISSVIGDQKTLTDLFEFSSHSDDKLAVAAFSFFLTIQDGLYLANKKIDYSRLAGHVHIMLNNVNTMKIRGTLDALKMATRLIALDDHVCLAVLNHLVDLEWCTYFLAQVSRLELLAAFDWKCVSLSIRSRYQSTCLRSLIHLLNNSDVRVRTAASSALVKFTENAVFEITHSFALKALPVFTYSNLISLHVSEEQNINTQFATNIHFVLEELSNQCLMPDTCSADNRITYIIGLEALLKTQSFATQLDNWFSDPALLLYHSSIVLKVLESASSNVSLENLISVLNVLSLLIKKKANPRAKEKAKQTVALENKMEMKVFLVFIRVINLYYTVYVENQVKNKNVSSNIFGSESPAKQAESRLNNISHLVGTGIHQMKASNYNESDLLRSFESTLQGSYKNYMESLDPDVQSRFLDPLVMALSGLEQIIPMFSFEDTKVFLDELLLYINRLMHFAIAPATGVLCELLKILFGRNISTPATSMMTRSSMIKKFEGKDYISKGFSGLACYLAKMSSADAIEDDILQQFSFLYCRSQIKRDHLAYETVVDTLQRFEKASAFLVSNAFFANNCAKTRCKIIDFLCILLLEGVQYRLADPKRRIYDFVVGTLRDPQLEMLPILPNLFNFLVVLCLVEPPAVKPADLETAVVILFDKLQEKEAIHGFSCIGLLLLFNISLSTKSIKRVQRLMVDNFSNWMSIHTAKCLQLWTLLLCCIKKDKDRALYDEVSSEFANQYFRFHRDADNAHTTWDPEALVWTTNTFFACSPNTFTPIDPLFGFLSQEDGSAFNALATIPIMTVISQMEESRILIRLDSLTEKPIQALSVLLVDCWLQLVEDIYESNNISSSVVHKKHGTFILVVQLLLYFMRANNQIGRGIKAEIQACKKMSLLCNCRQNLGESYFFVLLVLAEAKHAALVSFLKFSDSDPAYLKTQINFLVADILRISPIRKEFTIGQLLEIIDQTAFGTYLIRFTTNAFSLLKSVGSECAVKVVQDQLDFLKQNPLTSLFSNFISQLFFVKNCVAALPESLETLYFKLQGQSNSHQRCRELLHFIYGEAEQAKTVENCDLFTVSVCTNSVFEIEEYAASAMLLEGPEFAALLNAIKPHLHKPFLKACFFHIVHANSEAVGQEDSISEFGAIAQAQQTLNHILCSIQCRDMSALNVQRILAGMYDICQEPFTFDGDVIEDAEDFFVRVFVLPLTESSLHNHVLPQEYFKSLAVFFSLDAVVDSFSPDYDCLELIGQFLALLLKNIDASIGRVESVKPKHWDVQISTVTRSEQFRDDILDLFYSVQKISFFLHNQKFIDSFISEDIERALRAICRLPLLSAMFVIPEVALRQSWSLRIDARSDRIFVPLVNIYILENPDVLRDFAFRTVWLGWANRSQFENYCTSLFGVLSTTPVGTELHGAVSEDNLYRSIMSVSVAVETITNLLIHSLLYPVPGNPVIGKYLVKYRESTSHQSYLGTRRGRLAASAKCQLLLSVRIETIFKEMFELTHDDNEYGVGQSSLMYLWSITGVLESGSGAVEVRKPISLTTSVSSYMMKQCTDLDTASTLRALLDNFIHWFNKAVVPITLQTAVFKSLLLLTDMIDDTGIYLQIYKEMKQQLENLDANETAFSGVIIFLLLKCVAVLGSDSLEGAVAVADVHKYIEELIISSLRSSHYKVRQYTLQGILYVLQSYLLDDLPNAFLAIRDLVLEELSRLCFASDVVTTGDFVPASYEQTLWAISFRFLEEAVPLDDKYKDDFIKLVSKLYADPRLSVQQRRLLSDGIESLIIHSNTYNEKLLPTVLDCLSTCQLQPLHIRSTVSTYIICVYKESSVQEKGRNEFSKTVDFNQLINIIAAFSSQPIVRELSSVVAFVLSSSASVTTLIDNITLLIATPPHKKDAEPPLLHAFDLAVGLIYSRILTYCARQSPGTAANVVIKQIAPRLAMISDPDYAAYLITLTLISVAQREKTTSWSLAVQSAYSRRRPLKPVVRQLPSLLKQFVAMTPERQSIASIEAALELFSLETGDDGQNFTKNPERIKHLV